MSTVDEQSGSLSGSAVGDSSGVPVGERRTDAVRAYLPIAVAAALAALVPIRYDDSRSMMGVVTVGVLFACYAVAFNIIFGSTGQLFLCSGALAGIGGYGSAILADRSGWPIVPALILSAVVSATVAAVLSWVAVRRALDTIFIGIVTIAFALSFENLILGKGDWTGGESGLRVSAGSDSWFNGQVWPYYLFLGLLVVYLVIYRALQRSRIGWAFRALRDDGLAAELSGVDVARYRILAGFLGGGMLGLAGGMYVLTESRVSPSTFEFGNVDVSVLVMLAFGGIGSLLGPVVGAAAFTWLDQVLEALGYAQAREVIYGIVVISLFLGFRRGIVPAVVDMFARRRPK
ncbi:MAG: branched-chain amino acid ABC transporter permease [Ilumatobacteraceae bacterium]